MTIFKKLPDDILNYLNDFLNNKEKVNLFYSKNNNQELIKVCYIKRIVEKYYYLTDKILEQNIFDQLIEINVNCNPKITNLNVFYQTLQNINISGYCGVNDTGIKDCLNLIEINASNNWKIKNLNKFSKTLQIIDVGWNCGVDDNGIRDCLKLIEINFSGNRKIKDLNKFNQTLELWKN